MAAGRSCSLRGGPLPGPWFRAGRDRRHTGEHLRRIEAAQDSHVRELDEPTDPNDPAGRAWRARIRQRFAELEAERAQVAALEAATSSDSKPPTSSDTL